ncbi:DUF6134 family protein [Flagellimonas lutimaris]|jgi:hypothetical protein|uniref:DUF6134 family protein n=1 Tax=Flagellimonas lutimaris TaxID=475082 RepID=UPI003F5CE361
MSARFIIIFFFLSVFGHQPADHKTLYFDIYFKDDSVGTLRATLDPKGSKVQYTSITSVSIKIIKQLKVDYEYLVTFEDGYLSESNVDVLINEKTHTEAFTKWTGNQYKFVKDRKNEAIMEEKVPYSTILLFFSEPNNVEQCYSEMDGSINTIVPLGDHRYKKINSKGKENIYQYHNGTLTEATIDGIVDFKIVKRN